LGDALAMTLLELKGFSSKDFAFLHPEGTLGKMLLFRVKDIMQAGSQIGVVSENIKLHDSILEMTAKRGILIVVNEYGILTGVFTYGDLGRLIKEKPTCFEYQMGDIMVKNPKVISQDQLAVFAVKLMGKYKITALVVVDRERKPIGIIHLHDCMEHGIKIM
jgi:arabinose-5-phosphate isomerase